MGTKFAHFYATKSRKLLLITPTPNMAVGPVETIEVSGIREARKIAAERSAKCWNF